MKRKLTVLFGILTLLLGACGGANEQSGEDIVVEDVEEDQQLQEEVNEEEDKPIEVKMDVNEELNFDVFDATVKYVELYEKDNSLLADIEIEWTNRDYQYGDEKTFFVSTSFDVRQGEESLIEINDAWNVENKNRSDVFFPNAAGGTWFVGLAYELNDKVTPIEIIFTPTTETEDSETITINIP